MLTRALARAPRLLALDILSKIFRRHPKTALRALPRFAITFLLGEWPLLLNRKLRRRRAQKWKNA